MSINDKTKTGYISGSGIFGEVKSFLQNKDKLSFTPRKETIDGNIYYIIEIKN